MLEQANKSWQNRTDRQKKAYFKLVHAVARSLCVSLCSKLGSFLTAQSSHHILYNAPLACHLLHTHYIQTGLLHRHYSQTGLLHTHCSQTGLLHTHTTVRQGCTSYRQDTMVNKSVLDVSMSSCIMPDVCIAQVVVTRYS